MKIIMPILTLSRGGAQRMLAEMANRLADMGHEVTVVIPQHGTVEYPMRCPVVFRSSSVLTEHDLPAGDVIVSNYYSTVFPAQRASEQGKGLHVRLALCYEPAFLPDNVTSFASYHVTPRLFVLSRWQQELVRLNHGVNGRIVPVGVNPDFYNQHIRGQTGTGPIVSTIIRRPEGGFSAHRGQEYLLEQLAFVKANLPGTVLRLICPPGEMAVSEGLQSLLRDPRFEIRTPANDYELCYHYNETDIFVSASTYDAGSLPGLEAMRCGAALVTLYAGGNMEYCVHEGNCLMSYRYENRLAGDIIRLIVNPQLRQQLAAKGEDDSWQYTWERSARIFADGLREMLY